MAQKLYPELSAALNEVQLKKLNEFVDKFIELTEDQFDVGIRLTVTEDLPIGLKTGEVISLEPAWDKKLNIPYINLMAYSIKAQVAFYDDSVIENLRKEAGDDKVPVVEEFHEGQRAVEAITTVCNLIKPLKVAFATDYYEGLKTAMQKEIEKIDSIINSQKE